MVKKNQRALSIPLNDAAFGAIESKLAIRHGLYVFYSPMTGDRFWDVKGALSAAVKRAGLGKVTWQCSVIRSHPASPEAAWTS